MAGHPALRGWIGGSSTFWWALYRNGAVISPLLTIGRTGAHPNQCGMALGAGHLRERGGAQQFRGRLIGEDRDDSVSAVDATPQFRTALDRLMQDSLAHGTSQSATV
jgi:hypothetical protein